MVPNIKLGSVLRLGHSILYMENFLTRFNHKKTLLRSPNCRVREDILRVGCRIQALGFRAWQTSANQQPDESVPEVVFTGLWFAGNEGLEKHMETTTMGYIGDTTRIHSFIPG